MSPSTEELIARLAASAGPVRRLAPPMVRATVWLVLVAVVAGGAVFGLSDLRTFAVRASDPRMAVELFATLATGVAGVIAAFHLSIPGPSRVWALLPAPFAVLWLAVSGVGCWLDWAEQTQRGWALGQSAQCFVFLIGVGVPLGAVLLFALRRSRPLQPRLTASVGAVGVAALTAFILQFFHPFDVTVMDLGTHLAAIAILIGLFSLSGRRGLEARP